MEATEMRRSTLQRKDRDELTQIAEALGRRPGSRARKGEIIDLILDLAAGGDGRGDASAVDDSSDGSAASDDASATDEGGETEGNGSDDNDAGSDEAARAAGQDASLEDGRPEPGNRRRRRRGRDRDNRSESNEQWDGEPIPVEGHLDLRSEGYGFLRVNGYLPGRDDAYVPVKLVRQYNLRKGDVIAGPSRPANRNEKNPALMAVETVNGGDPEAATRRPDFDDLAAVHPTERLVLSADAADSSTAKIVDLVAPIGKGQRGLIVSPPRAGKTAVVKQIVRSLQANNPDVRLIVLLVDERPEEISDMVRWVGDAGEVVGSTFDRAPDEHMAIAELTVERAKRLVEEGNDVCLVFDDLTRLVRAYNVEMPSSGKTHGSGVDAIALLGPKSFLAAARAIEDGGSLTILSTAQVDNGSEVDQVIFEEFVGAANMELRLDRRLAERRIYPAIDVDGSSTRHEELLFPEEQLPRIRTLRRVLADLAEEKGAGAAIEMLLDGLRDTAADDFLAEVASSASGS